MSQKQNTVMLTVCHVIISGHIFSRSVFNFQKKNRVRLPSYTTDLGPLLQGQTRIAKLKSAYNSLIFGPRGLGW